MSKLKLSSFTSVTASSEDFIPLLQLSLGDYSNKKTKLSLLEDYILGKTDGSGIQLSGSNGITGSLTVDGNVTITGYLNAATIVSSSTVDIGDNRIVLNTLSASAQRYGGLDIQDSGSAVTASFLWDSQDDIWSLSKLTASSIIANSFTGSLAGTAATASYSVSSSYALTASYANVALSASLATTASYFPNTVYSSSIYIGLRNDGKTGNGSQWDPFDGSTAAKFDTILRNYRLASSRSLDIVILPGVYQTRGNYDYFNNGGLMDTIGWSAYSNWRIRGSGVEVTTLRLTGSTDCVLSGSGYGSLRSSPIATFHYDTISGVEVCDMTIDGNYNVISASIAAAYGLGINVSAVGLRGNSHYIHDIKVINVASNNGNEGFPINIGAQNDGGLTDGIQTVAGWIENVEAYPTGGYMTCIMVSNDLSGSIFDGGVSGYIKNNTVVCPTGSNQIIAFGGYSMNGLEISENVCFNAHYAVNVDTFRNRNTSIVNNKFLSTHTYGIFFGGGTTGSADPYAANNILIDGNVFEQRTNTQAIAVGGGYTNNYIITHNSFDTSGSGQTNIEMVAFHGSSTTSSNILVSNNYVNTSSYNLPNFTNVSRIGYDYSVKNEVKLSGSLNIKNDNLYVGSVAQISSSGRIYGYVPAEFMLAASDETTDLTSGSNKIQFIFPFALTGSTFVAYVNTTPSGSQITCSARIIGGTTLSSSINAGDKSGSSSPVYYINKYQEVAVDLNQVGSITAGKGLKVLFEGTRRI